MVNAVFYYIELRSINSGQRFVFDIVTNNLARFIREWNKDNPVKIWRTTVKSNLVRVRVY